MGFKIGPIDFSKPSQGFLDFNPSTTGNQPNPLFLPNLDISGLGAQDIVGFLQEQTNIANVLKQGQGSAEQTAFNQQFASNLGALQNALSSLSLTNALTPLFAQQQVDLANQVVPGQIEAQLGFFNQAAQGALDSALGLGGGFGQGILDFGKQALSSGQQVATGLQGNIQSLLSGGLPDAVVSDITDSFKQLGASSAGGDVLQPFTASTAKKDLGGTLALLQQSLLGQNVGLFNQTQGNTLGLAQGAFNTLGLPTAQGITSGILAGVGVPDIGFGPGGFGTGTQFLSSALASQQGHKENQLAKQLGILNLIGAGADAGSGIGAAAILA